VLTWRECQAQYLVAPALGVIADADEVVPAGTEMEYDPTANRALLEISAKVDVAPADVRPKRPTVSDVAQPRGLK
jgi:hypothetical protein